MANNKNDGLRGMIAWPTQFFLRKWELHQERSQQIVSVVKDLQCHQSTHIESGVAIGAKPASGLFEGNFDLFSESDRSLQELVSFIRQDTCTSRLDCEWSGGESRANRNRIHGKLVPHCQ